MKRIILIISAISLGLTSQAQVGIGNPNPDVNSVLDLTNPNDKGLVLPTATNPAGMAGSPEGLLYYYGSKIYYRESGGYNALSPWRWKFNGNVSNDMYFNESGGRVGIGTTTPQTSLHIFSGSEASLSQNGFVTIGTTTGQNIALDSDEIQAKNNGSASALTLNENGGDVNIGTSSQQTDIRVGGQVEQYHGGASPGYAELVPCGSIIIWYGSLGSVPKGWAICNGNSYARSDGAGSISTPNLGERVVIGAGSNGSVPGVGYIQGSTGGVSTVVLTVAQMPLHSHGSGSLGGDTDDSGDHNHGGSTGDGGYASSSHGVNGTSTTNSADNSGSHNHFIIPDGDHDHSLNITGSTASEGGGTPHENRPPYYALYYIMKL